MVLGTVSDSSETEFVLTGHVDNKAHTMRLKATPEASSTEFAFLPGMIREARNDRGLRLPTLGSAGLREFAAVRTKKSDHLSDLAELALNSGCLLYTSPSPRD